MISIGGAIALISSTESHASPAFTAQTKLPCTQCHAANPPDPQKLTDFGKKFKDNGNKLPAK
jgi:hypothetical protein